MTNVLPDPGNLTINLAPYRLRLHEEQARTIWGPDPAATTLVIDQRTGQPYHLPKVPTFVPYSDATGADAWIGDTLTEPTGPVPQPLPAPGPPPQPTKLYADGVELCGCCGHERTPFGERGRRRRIGVRVSPWTAVAIALVVSAGVWLGLVLAAKAVFG